MKLMKRIFALGVFLLGCMLAACSDDSNDELQREYQNKTRCRRLKRCLWVVGLN